jgi:hypothetical protein
MACCDSTSLPSVLFISATLLARLDSADAITCMGSACGIDCFLLSFVTDVTAQTMALTARQIKALIVGNGDTIKGLAFRFSTKKKVYAREDLSRVIHRQRPHPELERKLAEYLGLPVEEVFGDAAQSPETLAQANQISS